MPVAAGGTRAAVVEGEHDAAADGYAGDACPCRGHHAGALVTQDQWRLRHEHVDAREQIGVAEPCAGYLDEYLARAGLGELDVLDLEGATAFAQYCSLDMQSNL